eukprot:GHVU01025790.1.p2 GENE.GHVU01025790.1~~GHVU01025790.1.p2  ORF type:complete len:148 (-),score=11.99 GHVU01025790.1:359-802(-)
MPHIELAWKDADMYLSPASSGAADSAASSAGGGAGTSALRSPTSAVPLVVQAAPATVGGCAISARQYKNDLSMRAQKFVDRIGHDRTKLQEFDLVLTAAETDWSRRGPGRNRTRSSVLSWSCRQHINGVAEHRKSGSEKECRNVPTT